MKFMKITMVITNHHSHDGCGYAVDNYSHCDRHNGDDYSDYYNDIIWILWLISSSAANIDALANIIPTAQGFRHNNEFNFWSCASPDV